MWGQPPLAVRGAKLRWVLGERVVLGREMLEARWFAVVDRRAGELRSPDSRGRLSPHFFCPHIFLVTIFSCYLFSIMIGFRPTGTVPLVIEVVAPVRSRYFTN
jgi:hypothetical protein